MPSLDTLPVELLHRIFDSLDAETILISMQYVCRRLNSVTNNYNRYILNFKSIFKHKFHRLCRGTHPKNVISLTLSDENQTSGQIGLFLSLYHIQDYTRLQSVTLISIEEPYLKIILEHLSTNCSLTSLVIGFELNSDLNTETILLISLLIGKNSLRKLDLNLGYEPINKLEWPVECSIQYLRLSDSIRFNKFCTILRCSPHLKTMILRDCLIYNIDEFDSIISNTISYRQLTSLTLEDCELEMTMIESLFSLIPSLVHLTINGNSSDLFDGARWEQFIQTKLPDLNNIQFAFQSIVNVSHDSTGLESLITPFQTPFWLETKQWFVTALCLKTSHLMNLYTTQDCAPKITFHPKASKILRSTAPMTTEDLIMMDNVRELTLDLMEMQADTIEQKEISTHRLFNKLTKLILRLDGDWPSTSLQLLSSLIDLSTIIDLEISIDFTLVDVVNTTIGIVTLLEKTTHIQSLIIPTRTVSLQTICLIVSHRIQHLQIPVNSVEDMKTILERFDHLSSVTFKFLADSVVPIAEIIEWLIKKGRDFTYQSTQCSLSLWLGKNRYIKH